MTDGNGGDALAGDILRSIAAEYKWKDWGVIEKAVAPVGAATLARYAGNYQLGPMKIAVTQTGDRMFVAALPLGPDPREIFPSGESTFLT